MKIFWLGLGALAFVCLPALRAQTVAIPDAPGLAAQPRLNLTLPPARYEAPASKTPETRDMACGAPGSGVYTAENHSTPKELAGVMKSYQETAASRIYSEWSARYKKIHGGSPTGGIVTLRVAVRPDGNYVEPEVAVSSGHPGEDAGAKQAVRDVVSFPPLPEGMTHPFVMCLSFGYNRYRDEMEAGLPQDEPWLDPSKTGAVPPKAKGKP